MKRTMERIEKEFAMKCEYEDCNKEAEMMVYSSRQDKVMNACWEHAKRIVDEDSPEYHHSCPNCGCLMPVN